MAVTAVPIPTPETTSQTQVWPSHITGAGAAPPDGRVAAAPREMPPASPQATAKTGESDKPLTRPSGGYFVFLVLALLAGFGGALLVDTNATWTPGTGVSAFAMLFVLTTAVERLLAIFSPWFGQTTAPDPTHAQRAEDHRDDELPRMPKPPKVGGLTIGGLTKSRLQSARDEAVAHLLSKPTEAAARRVSLLDELLIQVRQNTSTIWAVGAAIGMLASAWWGVLLLHSLGVTEVSRPVDFFVTGLVVGGGSKAINELVGNMQASKDAARSAAG